MIEVVVIIISTTILIWILVDTFSDIVASKVVNKLNEGKGKK